MDAPVNSDVWDLFLDDERYPPRPSPVSNVRVKSWVIARTYEDAVALVKTRGFPRSVSLDHDLGPRQKTGMDFAKWLVNHAMDNGYPYFDVTVHSMNPVGKMNIELLLGQYLTLEPPERLPDDAL